MIDDMELTIQAAVSRITFDVEIVDDSVYEATEEFLVSLSLVNPRRGELLASDTTSILIVDNDG